MSRVKPVFLLWIWPFSFFKYCMCVTGGIRLACFETRNINVPEEMLSQIAYLWCELHTVIKCTTFPVQSSA